jgi:hypothetical protein
MRRFTPTDEPLEQWTKMGHYRLHCAERWPDSDYKEAVLAAIRSTLNTLEAASLAPVRAPALVLEWPSRSQSPAAITRLAA